MKRFFFLIALLVLALFVAPVLAQDAAPPQAPDLSPMIDNFNASLQTFMSSSAVLMGVLAFIITQVAKFVLPQTEKINSETIYGVVVSLFTLLYVGANLAGYTDALRHGVEVGTVLADPIMTLLGMLVVPSAAYAVGQKINNPLMGGRQGKTWMALEKPKHAPKAEPLVNVNAGQLAQRIMPGEVG